MDNQKYEIYKNIMSDSPTIDKGYLRNILQLSENENVNSVEITGVAESNTALVIKASVQIQSPSGSQEKKLFIKTMKRNDAENAYHNISMKEGKFYKCVKKNAINNLPIPYCYDVFLSEEKGEFVIVLDDISNRYAPADNAMLTDKAIWFSCAESLAQFHAAFWNREIIPSKRAGAEHDDQADRECVQSFLNDFKNQFDGRIKKILTQAMEINIALIKDAARRINGRDNVTICNGDSHIGNFMLPKRKTDFPLMIDFQFWGEGVGTGDLAHLTRDRFPGELKREIQLSLVERYHQSLLSLGITDYPLEKCLEDYRTGVASMALIPLWQYSGFGLKYDDWIDDLRIYVDNFEYMQCGELCRAL